MVNIALNTKSFERKMLNIVKYSSGFIDGAQRGKTVFLRELGAATIEALQKYIDTNAKMNPEALHHVYEWYKVGSPRARLYDLDYTISNLGLSIKSSFRQSDSIKRGSEEPFYNKAMIMEKGIAVTISPKKNVLVFDVDGETVFTSSSVYVAEPGGAATTGAYEKVFDEFFNFYFSQSFLQASGIYKYLQNPKIYKKNLTAGANSGRSAGIKTGYTWIINARAGITE